MIVYKEAASGTTNAGHGGIAGYALGKQLLEIRIGFQWDINGRMRWRDHDAGA